jgi:hypothetical protein
MNAPLKGKTELLLARDGDRCWFCGGRLNFSAVPNSKKAPTIEHLTPRSLGGKSDLDNLRLCHPGCNRHLGDRPREQKERLRAKRLKLPAASPPIAPVVSADAKTSNVVRRSANWATRFWLMAVVAAFFAGICVGHWTA